MQGKACLYSVNEAYHWILLMTNNGSTLQFSQTGAKQLHFENQWWQRLFDHFWATGKQGFKTLRSRQNGRRFPDDIFKCIFLNENLWISLQISPKFVLNVRINNIPALVRIMAWRRLGDKPLSEPMIGNSLTHLCVTRPQWLKTFEPGRTNILYIFFLFSWNMEKNIFRFRFHSNLIWSSGEQSRIKSSVPFTWCRDAEKMTSQYPNLI